MAIKKLLILLIVASSLTATVVLAQEFSSTNFVDSNPVVTLGGGKSSSTNFQLFSGAGQTIIGESSSSAFAAHAGFFYFPFVSTPVLSATAGDGEVSLSWTSAVGSLGFNISTYSIGRSTNSGGPYTFTNVGNVLSAASSGLTNGTTYYFVVRALDSLSDSVVTSTQIAAVPVVSAGTPGGGAVGGSGVALPTPQTIVIFSGFAYPNSRVTLLKDGQIAGTAFAGTDAFFQISAPGLFGGSYIFSIYSEDNKGFISPLVNFPLDVIAGASTQVGGVLVPPTIAADKTEVKRGDSITFFGQAIPRSEINIMVNSEKEFFIKTSADVGGNYLYSFDSSPLELGDHSAKAKLMFNGEISVFGKFVDFRVGTKNISADSGPRCLVKADLNNDCRVNLVDVSILIFWFDKSGIPSKVDFDGNGRVDLIDLSILAYYWTG
ncbi:MAG: hypothetical protein A2534_01635 [Candidatus Magasanikbacteria bacterium RIFOXYD2_FULL_39_9]|uniref:Fibronectin type-III domain-containing protein n=1 Tax=Candidatus Magasanikbacteria bacterium RIFOXYD1_FULL_40_23 TaxID=1798705 RepID=A0A1F6PA35_9BACT|nr:MAG: hypothetical protein A2563_04610 [Candidatus Magasanikbacteria bacterium RIFOXYD1_FULL_40_23]OGH93578.1 MAG: hypothetical protein A2534_01635 [Candidatus Magasanikbacteria bacterium RIFOXYD2_FULL_39_9]